jgi:hypothetical protein
VGVEGSEGFSPEGWRKLSPLEERWRGSEARTPAGGGKPREVRQERRLGIADETGVGRMGVEEDVERRDLRFGEEALLERAPLLVLRARRESWRLRRWWYSCRRPVKRESLSTRRVGVKVSKEEEKTHLRRQR